MHEDRMHTIEQDLDEFLSLGVVNRCIDGGVSCWVLEEQMGERRRVSEGGKHVNM